MCWRSCRAGRPRRCARRTRRGGIEIESRGGHAAAEDSRPARGGRRDKLMRLIEALEDLDDVDAVHANFDVDAEILERVPAHSGTSRAGVVSGAYHGGDGGGTRNVHFTNPGVRQMDVRHGRDPAARDVTAALDAPTPWTAGARLGALAAPLVARRLGLEHGLGATGGGPAARPTVRSRAPPERALVESPRDVEADHLDRLDRAHRPGERGE